MVATLDDCFVVFVRDDDTNSGNANPALAERELVKCPTLQEAEWVRRECAGPKRKCIIRYLGPAGGGD